MNRQPYKAEKRRKEIARQKKQEEKRLKRQEKKKAKDGQGVEGEPLEGTTPEAASIEGQDELKPEIGTEPGPEETQGNANTP
jgi:hypothetical protein